MVSSEKRKELSESSDVFYFTSIFTYVIGLLSAAFSVGYDSVFTSLGRGLMTMAIGLFFLAWSFQQRARTLLRAIELLDASEDIDRGDGETTS